VPGKKRSPSFKNAPGGKVRWRAALVLAAAALACPPALQADQGDYGLQAGAALPFSGAKTWVGSGPGFAFDITDTFTLDTDQRLRMRLGYLFFQGVGPGSESLALPGAAYASFPASSSNQLYQITYGVDYLRNLNPAVYLVGGVGFAYATATRSGTVNLTSAGAPSLSYKYDANKLVPYLCVGAGYEFSSTLALEARFQMDSMGSQVRRVDLSAAGYGQPGLVQVPSLTVATLVLGLVVTF
jgi:hypothetical protein